MSAQDGWRHCINCQQLVWTDDGHCAGVAGAGKHRYDDTKYQITYDDNQGIPPGQPNWRWCDKCQALVYAGNPDPGACPAGGTHETSQSYNYFLGSGNADITHQASWAWCAKCQGMVFTAGGTPGACPAGGTHDTSQGEGYTLQYRPLLDGVFKGGGVLGAAYTGVLKCLTDQGLWFKRVAGASAGAITGSLIAAGFSADEIEFLCAPALANLPRPSNLPASAEAGYLSYEKFVDPPNPLEVLTSEARKHTLTYLFLRGPAFDAVKNLASTNQRIDALVKSITDAVYSKLPGSVHIDGFDLPRLGPYTPHVDAFDASIPFNRTDLENAVRSQLPTTIFAFLAEQFIDDDQHRDLFADLIFPAVVITRSPVFAPLVPNLLYLMWNGGLLKGDAFLERIRTALAMKGVVTFRDLPMDLVVIASDITAQTMLIYSKKASPDMEVAEAVRRSMSIPFIFCPRVDADGHEIMDGGMCDNLPVWPFLFATNDATDNNPEDIRRPKLIFYLDDSIENAGNGCEIAPFRVVVDMLGGGGLDIAEKRLFNRITGEHNLRTSHSAESLLMVNL